MTLESMKQRPTTTEIAEKFVELLDNLIMECMHGRSKDVAKAKEELIKFLIRYVDLRVD